jgi:ATP-binding cassette subfamily B protein
MRGDGYARLPAHPPNTRSIHSSILIKALQYLWRTPCSTRALAVISLVLLVLAKAADIAVPLILKLVIDQLLHEQYLSNTLVLAYVATRFSATLLDSLRSIAFSTVAASIERDAALEVFKHLNKLSLDFHLQRKTGAVIRSVSRGASSFTSVLSVILFQLFPVLIQICIVCSYLFWKYQWWFAVLTFGTITVYFLFTLITTDWRNKYRRIANEKDNEFNQKSVDALMNFETVKYFNAEEHESARYDEALMEYRKASILSQNTLSLLNSGQDLIISVGIAAAMYLSGNLLSDGEMTIGDFVLIQQFILTLYEPLGFLGSYYRMLRQSFIDIESMLAILNEKITIQDKADARQLNFISGKVEFKNVYFSYSKDMPILRGVSFSIEPGQKVAIVGPSGAGKR